MKIKFSKFSNLTFFKISIALSFFVLLSACSSIKPAGVKSGKKLFETFYVGEDGTQYFIKPLIFLNSQNKEKFLVDFTFRYKNEVKDSVIVNFSLLSSNIFKNVDSLSFSNTTHKIMIKNVNLMFNERKNKLFNSRFSTKTPLINFDKMFINDDWKIIVYSGETNSTYHSKKKTKKAIKELQDKIFILFQ